MAEMTRLKMSDIVVGEALQWNAYDANGKLLLHKGVVIESPNQLEALIARGMYLFGADRGTEEERAPEVEELSPFDLIDGAQGSLERLLGRMADEVDFPDRLLEIAAIVQQAVAKDVEAAMGSILLEGHPRYSIRHSMHAAVICEIVAKFQGKSDEERLPILAAALSMNAAMLFLQDKLQSRKEPLDQKLREELRTHPERGVERLKAAGVTDPVWLDGVLHHHECLDGSGYPQGLKGGEISYAAKLIYLADIYDARISSRDYRPARPPSLALKDIFLSRGQKVDATLAAILVKELGIYPPGTFLQLANGEIAVAVRRGGKPDTPVVQSVVGARNNVLSVALRRNTALAEFTVKEVITQSRAGVKVNRNLLWGYKGPVRRG